VLFRSNASALFLISFQERAMAKVQRNARHGLAAVLSIMAVGCRCDGIILDASVSGFPSQ